MLQTLDFEDLAAMGMGASYTFQVEAVDQGGVTPPGLATVTVRITVRTLLPFPVLCILPLSTLRIPQELQLWLQICCESLGVFKQQLA